MALDDPAGYQLLERTLELHGALDDAQVAAIGGLLGRELGRAARGPGYVLELTAGVDADAVLAQLRAWRVAHTLAEERRWEPP